MKQLAVIMSFILIIACTACSSPTDTSSVDESSGIIEINSPEQLIGKPDRIAWYTIKQK